MRLLPRLALLGLAVSGLIHPLCAQSYKVTNMISDGSVPATVTDAGFINPWAISTSGTWWISAQGTGQSYVVPVAGTVSFKVVVPPASGLATATGFPAGSVTTGGASGMVLPNATKASFLFSTLDGTISGWNSKLGTAGAIAQVVVNNSAAGASYPGLAIENVNATTSYVLAPNFGTGNAVEVYDSTFKSVKLAGSFTDPNLPAGYAPFGIHVLGTQVFVTYALRTAAPFRTVSGPGNGVVDIYDMNGNLTARAVTGGNLNAPWGVAYAPANFGVFSNALLIGNFGDGKINAYDPKTYTYLGQLMDVNGKPLAYASLWELLTGGTAVSNTTSVSGGDTSTVYFTAGLANEAHGLFAGITNSVTAGSTPTFGFSTSSGAATVTDGGTVQTAVSVVPANGFSGTVSLSCTGAAGVSCAFSPAQMNVSSTSVASGTVVIRTSKPQASLAPFNQPGGRGSIETAAALLPLALLLFRRRKERGSTSAALRLLSLLLLCVMGGLFAGCAQGGDVPQVPTTPTGQSTVTMTATSGTVSQQSTFVLNVQ